MNFFFVASNFYADQFAKSMLNLSVGVNLRPVLKVFRADTTRKALCADTMNAGQVLAQYILSREFPLAHVTRMLSANRFRFSAAYLFRRMRDFK